MIKKIAWDTFKNTGDINAFLELKQIENIQNQLGNITENIDKQGAINKDGKHENKWSDTI